MNKTSIGILAGFAAGVAVGVLGYKFAQTEKAEELKDDALRAWLKARIKARKVYRSAKDKALDMSVKATDKMADGAHAVAEKADSLKAKVASKAAEA